VRWDDKAIDGYDIGLKTRASLLKVRASRRNLAILIACVVVLSSASALVFLTKPGTMETPQKARIAYTSAPTFAVISDSDFPLMGFTGTGTSSDPYVFSGYDVESDGTYPAAIYIKDTSSYFVIKDCYLHGIGDGAYLLNAGNGTIESSSCSNNSAFGIHAEDSSGLVLINNTCSANSNGGIYLWADNDLNISMLGNTILENNGYGIEAYASAGNISALISGCNVSENWYSGIYLQALTNLNLSMNETAASWDSQSGGWSAGIEAYAQNGNLAMALSGCNISYNGNEGIYAEANGNLNMSLSDSNLTWNDMSGGWSTGIDATAYNGNLGMILNRTVISDQGDQGIYAEAGGSLALLMNSTDIVRNNGGDTGGDGIEAYAYGGDILVAMSGCNISDSYGNGMYLDASNNLYMLLGDSTLTWNGGYGIYAYATSGDMSVGIDGCNISNNANDGMLLQASNDFNLSLTGTTITWNNADGIEAYSYGANFAVVMSGCNVSYNTNSGLYSYGINDASLTVTDCNVTWNTNGYGLCLQGLGGNARMVSVRSNVSDNGNTGVYLFGNNNANATVTAGVISRNGGNGMDAAYAWNGNVNLTLSRTEIIGNTGFGVNANAYWSDVLATINECNISGNGNTGVYLQANSNIDLALTGNMITSNGGDGVRGLAYNGNLLGSADGCNFSGNGGNGIYLNAATGADVAFVGDIATGNGNNGIEGLVWKGALVGMINGCNISGNLYDGIYLSPSVDSFITDNAVWMNTNTGIQLDTFNSGTVDRNTCVLNGGNGISVTSSSGGVVGNNTCVGSAQYGINVESSSGLTVSDNTCTGSSADGIRLYQSNGNRITRNDCTGNLGSGIGLNYYSSVNSVDNNTCEAQNGNYGIALISVCNSNVVENNTCDNIQGQGVYLGSCNDNIVRFNAFSNTGDAGISLYDSSGNTINWNTITDASQYGPAAIIIQAAPRNVISNNTCTNSRAWGIYMSSGSDNTVVENNTVSGSNGTGIAVAISNGCSIHDNLVMDSSGYAVALYFSTTGNRVWNNTFLFNNGATDVWNASRPQAYDGGTNSWNTSGTPHGYGNFWNDWTTPDMDHDGIVDNPYALNGTSAAYDYYPLAGPLAPVTKLIFGYITDDAGNPLMGASVSVTIIHGEITIVTKATVTDANGYYAITLEPGQWEAGFTIQLTIQYGTAQETVTAPCDGSTSQEVDYQYPYEIPQFGSLIGFLVAGLLVGIVAVVLLKRGRK